MSQIFGATEVKCDQNRFTYKQQGRSYGRASAVAGLLGRDDGDKLALNAQKKVSVRTTARLLERQTVGQVID